MRICVCVSVFEREGAGERETSHEMGIKYCRNYNDNELVNHFFSRVGPDVL